jgi:hypothetical protein
MEFTDPWRARSGTSTAKPGQGCIQTDEGRLIKGKASHVLLPKARACRASVGTGL